MKKSANQYLKPVTTEINSSGNLSIGGCDLVDLAKKYKLMLSGGSDFHGSPDRFPKELGIFTVNENQVDRIFWNDL